MPLPNNINAYADIEVIMRQARRAGGAKYTLPSYSAAVRWRLRAYKWRRLLQRQAEASSNIPGHTPATPYDMMLLSIVETAIHIKFEAEVAGVLELPEGFEDKEPSKLEIPGPGPATVESTDPFMLAALELLKEKSDDNPDS